MADFLYEEPDARGAINVLMDGVHVGEIRPHNGGYFYKPRTAYGVGPLRQTLADVKRSIEGDA